MSTTDLRDLSRLKVLFDFQYETAEGRRIFIEKDEKLYLLQKTNNDWWQVVRTREQRSFYVPASYVEETPRTSLSKMGKSERERDGVLKVQAKYNDENARKECLDKVKTVEKWLAVNAEGTRRPSGDTDASANRASNEDVNIEGKSTKSKRAKEDRDFPEVKEEKRGLERFRNVIKRFSGGSTTSDDARGEANFKTSKKSSNASDDIVDKNEISSKISNCFKQKEKDGSVDENSDVKKRHDLSPNPFQKELESSLERRFWRKISGNLGHDDPSREDSDHRRLKNSIGTNDAVEEIIAKDLRPYDTMDHRENAATSHGAILSSKRVASPVASSAEDVPNVARYPDIPSREKLGGRERSRKISSSSDKSSQEELRTSLEKINASKRHVERADRHSMKLDANVKGSGPSTSSSSGSERKYNAMRRTSASPHAPSSFEGPPTPVIEEDGRTDEVLNDKRKSWAIEELMSELTQMRRERTDDKILGLELKSTEIKGNFDPLDTLTRELHEMRLLRSGSATSLDEDASSNGNEPVDAARNISSGSSGGSREKRNNEAVPPSESHSGPTGATDVPRPTRRFQRDAGVLPNPMDIAMERSFVFEKPLAAKSPPLSTNVEATPKMLKSPKSPKILDEYNEANILNDGGGDDEDDDAAAAATTGTIDMIAPLSSDKECKLSSYQGHSKSIRSDADNLEKSCYSNVSLNADKFKLRPKVKVNKVSNASAEIKLTPSLEKLASEIQFLPANKVTATRAVEEKIGIDSPLRGDANANREKDHYFSVVRGLSNSDDALNSGERPAMWKKLKFKLNYKGSFKGETEGKALIERKLPTRNGNNDAEAIVDHLRPGKPNLRKCATFHYDAVPERYPQIWRKHSLPGIGNSRRRRSRSRSRRRSYSLGDLREIEELPACDDSVGFVSKPSEGMKSASHKPTPLPRTKIPATAVVASNNSRLAQSVKAESMPIECPSRRISTERKIGENDDSDATARLSRSYTSGQRRPNVSISVISRSYQNLKDEPSAIPRLTDIDRGTAVGFKNLLCTSDSGSDEYLHHKAFPKSFDKGGSNLAGGCTSDEHIPSSNPSSEALPSQSESEVYITSELSDNPSPVNAKDDGAETTENFIELPSGWIQKFDPDTKQICFVNDRGDKWFSSHDNNGRIYFFEENSNQSSWVLPGLVTGNASVAGAASTSYDEVEVRNSSGNAEKIRAGKARSMVLVNQSAISRELATKKSGSMPRDWPQLFDGNMCILKEGTMNRTKITENGKKLRKNWSTSHVVLTELFLLFFKDAKTFAAMKSGQSATAKPDISVDLNGALVEPGERTSSRKNVYVISTVLGLQVLIQSDNAALAGEWYDEIDSAISRLPSGFDIHGKPTMCSAEGPQKGNSTAQFDTNSPEETKKISKIGRSRSVRIKGPDGSLEDLSGTAVERQTKIKAKLRRFFQRRPTMDLLVKNGIYKDEPAFGSYLNHVCPVESPRVPRFVKSCIEVLENNTENMKTDGLYRASGNLSQIQKIRLQIDQNNLDILKQEEDVHVLTGALKLFFRELKEPLVPFTFFEKALNASMLKKRAEKIQCFREIVKALPPANHDTLQFLLQHLLRVTSYQEYNRMHIPNLAIVFGPTLMWPAEESANMALDLMQQNLVIECLLSEYDRIFK